MRAATDNLSHLWPAGRDHRSDQMSASERLRHTAGHSPVEEWFRLSTRQRAQQFHPAAPDPLKYSSPPEESDAQDDVQLLVIDSLQASAVSRANEHAAAADTPGHDARQRRGELQSLINSLRKTGRPEKEGVADESSFPHHPSPPSDAPLTNTRKELLVLINSYRKTCDVSMPAQGDGSNVSALADSSVARGLDFEHLLDVSMHRSANPTESVLVPPPTVHKSGAFASDALWGLSDVFADVSAVAEQRLQRGSPGRPLHSSAIPQEPRPSVESALSSEKIAGEKLSANVEVANLTKKQEIPLLFAF